MKTDSAICCIHSNSIQVYCQLQLLVSLIQLPQQDHQLQQVNLQQQANHLPQLNGTQPPGHQPRGQSHILQHLSLQPIQLHTLPEPQHPQTQQ